MGTNKGGCSKMSTWVKSEIIDQYYKQGFFRYEVTKDGGVIILM